MLVAKRVICAIAVAVLVLAACGDEDGAGAGVDAPSELSLTCKVFERPSVESSTMKGRTLRLGPEPTTRSVTLGDFRVRAQYAADDFDGRTLDVFIFPKGESEPLSQNKYQFDSEKSPENQFLGGQGFTGLVYVNHPQTEAELQFFCEADD